MKTSTLSIEAARLRDSRSRSLVFLRATAAFS